MHSVSIPILLFVSALGAAADSLDRWIQARVDAHPLVAAATKTLAGAETARAGAGRLADPSLGLEVEEIGVEDALETTLTLDMDLGLRRRGPARALGEIGLATAQGEVQRLRHDLRLALLERCHDLFEARELRDLAQRKQEVLRAILADSEHRFRAGVASPLEPERLQLSLARQAAEQAARQTKTDAAQRALSIAAATSVTGLPKPPVPPLPTESPDVVWTDTLAAQPHRRRLEAAQARRALARVEASPGPHATVGLRNHEDSGERSVLVGVALPLPLWNRNGAGIGAADQDIARARTALERAELDWRIRRVQLDAERDAADAARRRFAEELLPAFQAQAEKTRAAYQEGNAEFLQWLETQSAAWDIEEELIRTRWTLHRVAARQTRLAATGNSE